MPALAALCARLLRFVLFIAASGLLAQPAAAQGGLRPAPGQTVPNLQRQWQTAYDIEIQNGRAGRLQLSASPAQATTPTGFNGEVFGDALTGRREPANGPMAWVSYRNGRPFEAYQASYHAASGYWLGTVHALDAASPSATPARSVWAFRARLSLTATRPGLSPRAPPPALNNPPGLPAGRTAHSFGQAVERYFPIVVGGAPRGWMRISVAANGAVSGRITEGHAGGALSEEALSGYYASGGGMLALARHASGAASEVLTGVLEHGVPFAGQVYRVSADRMAQRRDWALGPFLQLANLRHGGCLSVPDDSLSPGAQIWLNKASNSDVLLPCVNAGPSRRWGFAVIEPDAQGVLEGTLAARFLIVNLHSGLCLTAPSEPDGRHTQEICASPSLAHFVVSGITNPDAATQDLQFDDLRQVSQLTNYPGYWLATAGPRCPGSYDSTLPWAVNVCGAMGAVHLRNTRGLWRVE
jgi:hypothetical protein